MRTVHLIPLAVLVLIGCQKSAEPGAYGNVEAVDVVVGAEAAGRIESFSVVEGQDLTAGAVVGTIATQELEEQHREATSQRAATTSRVLEIEKQIGALEVQREIAQRNYERTKRLHEQRAATSQQLDQAERDHRVLGLQIESLRAQKQAMAGQLESSEARIAQIGERIAKASIRNPIDGTVLARYAAAGEVTQPGQPLYRIADLSNVEVRAYVVETQLASLRVGQRARVSVDVGKDERTVLTGTVTWVSSEAEFTPTPIQTREQRADLVYAVKIRVSNPNGTLKIGMPVDVDFSAEAAAR